MLLEMIIKVSTPTTVHLQETSVDLASSRKCETKVMLSITSREAYRLTKDFTMNNMNLLGQELTVPSSKILETMDISIKHKVAHSSDHLSMSNRK
jgi:hypothetical protein